MPWYEVDQRLIDTAIPEGSPVPNDGFGYGIVNLAKAVNRSAYPVSASAPNPVYARFQSWLTTPNGQAFTQQYGLPAQATRPSAAHSATAPAPGRSAGGRGGLPVGAILVIVLAVLAVLGVAGGAVAALVLRSRRRRTRGAQGSRAVTGRASLPSVYPDHGGGGSSWPFWGNNQGRGPDAYSGGLTSYGPPTGRHPAAGYQSQAGFQGHAGSPPAGYPAGDSPYDPRTGWD